MIGDQLDNFAEELKLTYKDKKANIYHYLPSPETWVRFSRCIPGVGRGSNILIYAGSGVGKSKFVRFFFVKNALYQAHKHNINLHIIYNNIEESTTQVFARDFILEYKKITGKKLTVFDLLGFTDIDGEDLITPHLDIIKDRVKKKYNNKVHFIKKSDVFEYYKYIVEFLLQHGKFYDSDRQIINPLVSKKAISSFIPNDKRFIFVVILDRILLMNGKDIKNVPTFIQSSIHNLFINNVCGGVTVTIQQQNDESSVAEYTRNGRVILDKVEPALSNLKENRATKDAASDVWGIFNPHRFDLNDDHRGYKLSAMNQHLRSLHINKSRISGADGKIIHFGFDGALEEWYEMPYPNSPKINEFYNFFQNL